MTWKKNADHLGELTKISFRTISWFCDYNTSHMLKYTLILDNKKKMYIFNVHT